MESFDNNILSKFHLSTTHTHYKMETATYTITIIHAPSQQDTVMANSTSSSCLDYSTHSVSTPPQQDIMESSINSMPLSPNGVDDYPENDSNKITASTTDKSCKNVSKKLNTQALPCAPSCASTCATVETDTFSAVSSLSATLHTSTKSVQFSPRVRVKDTVSRHDMTEEERTDYWLKDQDFLLIKRRNQKIILATLEAQKRESQKNEAFDDNDDDSVSVSVSVIESDCDSQQQSQESSSISDSISIDDEEEYCLRGLEAGLPNENLRRRSYRFAALEEVLLEQEDQYFAGILDEEAIAEVYMEVTVECRFRAEFKGIQDAQEIEEYMQEGPQLAYPKAATPFYGEEDDEFALE